MLMIAAKHEMPTSEEFIANDYGVVSIVLDCHNRLHPCLMLPGLVLTIFLALLPILLTFMNKRAGMQSKAEIDFGVFQKFFIFQARLAQTQMYFQYI